MAQENPVMSLKALFCEVDDFAKPIYLSGNVSCSVMGSSNVGSIDPHKGKMGAREARRLVEQFGVFSSNHAGIFPQ